MHNSGKRQQIGGIWTLVGIQTPRAGDQGRDKQNNSNGYRKYLRQQNGSYYLDLWAKRKCRSKRAATSVRFSQAGHVTNEEPVKHRLQ